VCKADNLLPSCAVVMKSGKLNFLESSGPLQACNGTDLTFYRLIRGPSLTGTPLRSARLYYDYLRVAEKLHLVGRL